MSKISKHSKKEVVDREIVEYLSWNAKYHKIFIVLFF